ncbi:LysM peptidoglycan-binding domain-containing protein [Natronospora cellulosivora (SeqCode)]
MKKFISTFALISFLILFSATQVMAATYTVKSGDSLWTISQEVGLSIEEIVEMNDLGNVNSIHIGQELKIAEEESIKTSTSYTVRSGDLLWRIADEFGVKIQEIIEHNNLEAPNFFIYIGQTLSIPVEEEVSEPVDVYLTYTVKAGDILWNIAQGFDTTVQELVELNNIENAFDLYVGRELMIPVSEDINDNEPVDEDNNRGQDRDRNRGRRNDRNRENDTDNNYVPYVFHRVNEGESIWNIANTFGISTRELMRANSIDSTRDLHIGDVLIISLNESNRNLSSIINNSRRVNNSYRVLRNESLEDIAEFYDVPEEGIRTINNMTANEEVYTGQRLLMPVNAAHFNEHKMHRVADGGEYIFDIAYEYGVSIRSILKANYLRDNNTRFEEGTAVLVPQDQSSRATWISYENGRPVNSWFGNRR